MTTAERLLKVDEGVEKVKALNAELEQTLYGTNTGGKSFYDEFWDSYQLGGTRKTLDFFFAGNGWTKDTLIPKHDMRPSRANNMFSLCAFVGDLAQHFENLGRALDFSNCTMAQTIFSNASSITRLGLIDFRKVTYGSAWFINMRRLMTIDKLLISENTVAPGSAFDDCSELINIAIEGVINKNGYNFKWSTKLSKASWYSIIGCYAVDLSLTMTGSKASVDKAFETSDGANDGSTSPEWLNLLATRPNLTVHLI